MLQSSQHTNKTSSSDPFGISPIKGFISHVSTSLLKLVDQLAHEQELLVNGTADQISEAAKDKLNCMQELSAYISEYFQKSNGTNQNSKDNLENSLQLINDICLKNKIVEWNEIKELINECYKLSEENSILLANRLKFTNNAIDTLYSLAGAPQTKTYDNKGISLHSSTSRQLASV